MEARRARRTASKRSGGRAPIEDVGFARLGRRNGIGSAAARLLCRGPIPCLGCPLAKGSGVAWPRTAVFPRRGGGYCVVFARPAGRDGYHVRQWLVSDSLFQRLLEARIAALVERSGLTLRERETFSMILTGRSPREMADALGVSVRTVKFHQANLLQKLGADSRADLLRVIL